MKPARVLILAIFVTLVCAGSALAQGGPADPTAERASMKAYLDKNGQITKEQFMEMAKARAEAHWKRLDPQGKGVVTKQDFEEQKAARQARRAGKGMKAGGGMGQ